jgi:cell division protein FtsB
MEADRILADSQPGRGLWASLAFWIALFGASGLYAAATLAPKQASLADRNRELSRQSSRVAARALEVERLSRQVHLLETDPEYLATIAKYRLGRVDAGETRLETSASPQSIRDEPMRLETPIAWYQPALTQIAGDSLLRSRMLLGAGALVLFGFTFLHPGPVMEPGEGRE